MSATDKIMKSVESLFALAADFRGAWSDMRHTIARTIGDLERARDAALEEHNRLGVELAGARTRIADLEARAAAAAAEMTGQACRAGRAAGGDRAGRAGGVDAR